MKLVGGGARIDAGRLAPEPVLLTVAPPACVARRVPVAARSDLSREDGFAQGWGGPYC